MNHSVIIIGERFNSNRREAFNRMPPLAWLELSLQLGAFNDSCSRLRLQSIGIDVASMRSMNITPPGPQWWPWEADVARRNAEAFWRHDLLNYNTVYLCGRRVAYAFGIGTEHRVLSRFVADPSQFGNVGRVATGDRRCDWPTLMILPHPSGLNRWWNDRDNLLLARDLVKNWI